MKARKEQQEQQQNQKQMIIRQLLEPEALERLQRIKLVKAEKAEKIENAIIMKVQKGEIQSKMDDNTLVRTIVFLPKFLFFLIFSIRFSTSSGDLVIVTSVSFFLEVQLVRLILSLK